MKTYKELMTEGRKAKGMIKTVGQLNFAVKINAVPDDYPTMPFGRQIDYRNIVGDFKKTAKTGYIDAKGKPTLSATKKWIKEMGATEYYAQWKKDSSSYKDDSVEILYKTN